MKITQVYREIKSKLWDRYSRYSVIIIGTLITIGVTIGLVFYWDELQDASAYGYLGCFVVSVMAGITVIPAPALPVVFTLGHKLNPLYVGLVAGMGEALGGLTIYLTGAGGGTLWSKLRGRRAASEQPESVVVDGTPLVPRRFESKQRALFNKIMVPMRRWGGFWVVFAAAAIIVSPYYLVGLAAGALGISMRKFFLASWAGKTVKGLYVAGAGYWGLYFVLGLFGD